MKTIVPWRKVTMKVGKEESEYEKRRKNDSVSEEQAIGRTLGRERGAGSEGAWGGRTTRGPSDLSVGKWRKSSSRKGRTNKPSQLRFPFLCVAVLSTAAATAAMPGMSRRSWKKRKREAVVWGRRCQL